VSQAEGSNDNDNDTDIAATRPSVPATTCPKGARDPASPEDPGAQGPGFAVNRKDNRWPRWPTAWPDGSFRSR
jgi:hypothetical protein